MLHVSPIYSARKLSSIIKSRSKKINKAGKPFKRIQFESNRVQLQPTEKTPTKIIDWGTEAINYNVQINKAHENLKENFISIVNIVKQSKLPEKTKDATKVALTNKQLINQLEEQRGKRLSKKERAEVNKILQEKIPEEKSEITQEISNKVIDVIQKNIQLKNLTEEQTSLNVNVASQVIFKLLQETEPQQLVEGTQPFELVKKKEDSLETGLDLINNPKLRANKEQITFESNPVIQDAITELCEENNISQNDLTRQTIAETLSGRGTVEDAIILNENAGLVTINLNTESVDALRDIEPKIGELFAKDSEFVKQNNQTQNIDVIGTTNKNGDVILIVDGVKPLQELPESSKNLIEKIKTIEIKHALSKIPSLEIQLDNAFSKIHDPVLAEVKKQISETVEKTTRQTTTKPVETSLTEEKEMPERIQEPGTKTGELVEPSREKPKSLADTVKEKAAQKNQTVESISTEVILTKEPSIITGQKKELQPKQEKLPPKQIEIPKEKKLPSQKEQKPKFETIKEEKKPILETIPEPKTVLESIEPLREKRKSLTETVKEKALTVKISESLPLQEVSKISTIPTPIIATIPEVYIPEIKLSLETSQIPKKEPLSSVLEISQKSSPPSAEIKKLPSPDIIPEYEQVTDSLIDNFNERSDTVIKNFDAIANVFIEKTKSDIEVASLQQKNIDIINKEVETVKDQLKNTQQALQQTIETSKTTESTNDTNNQIQNTTANANAMLNQIKQDTNAEINKITDSVTQKLILDASELIIHTSEKSLTSMDVLARISVELTNINNGNFGNTAELVQRLQRIKNDLEKEIKKQKDESNKTAEILVQETKQQRQEESGKKKSILLNAILKALVAVIAAIAVDEFSSKQISELSEQIENTKKIFDETFVKEPNLPPNTEEKITTRQRFLPLINRSTLMQNYTVKTAFKSPKILKNQIVPITYALPEKIIAPKKENVHELEKTSEINEQEPFFDAIYKNIEFRNRQDSKLLGEQLHDIDKKVRKKVSKLEKPIKQKKVDRDRKTISDYKSLYDATDNQQEISSTKEFQEAITNQQGNTYTPSYQYQSPVDHAYDLFDFSGLPSDFENFDTSYFGDLDFLSEFGFADWDTFDNEYFEIYPMTTQQREKLPHQPSKITEKEEIVTVYPESKLLFNQQTGQTGQAGQEGIALQQKESKEMTTTAEELKVSTKQTVIRIPYKQYLIPALAVITIGCALLFYLFM